MLLSSFSPYVVDNAFEGILSVRFTDTNNGETLVVCVCYLPPSNSSREHKNIEFLSALNIIVLDFQELDNFFICGDFNA